MILPAPNPLATLGYGRVSTLPCPALPSPDALLHVGAAAPAQWKTHGHHRGCSTAHPVCTCPASQLPSLLPLPRRARRPRGRSARWSRRWCKAATGVAAASEPLCVARRSSSCQHHPKFPRRHFNLTHDRLSAREVAQSPSSYIRPLSSWTPSPRRVPFSSLDRPQQCLLYDSPPRNTLPFGHMLLLRAAHASPSSSASTNTTPDAQDSQEEECQEGNPVLPDGLRCLRNRYVYIAPPVHRASN